MIQVPQKQPQQPGMPGMGGMPGNPGAPEPAQLLANGNLPTDPEKPGAPTVNQNHAQALSRFLVKNGSGGSLNGSRK